MGLDMIRLEEVRFVGQGLERPECVLATAEGALYVGALDSRIHALDAASGQPLWDFEVERKPFDHGAWYGSVGPKAKEGAEVVEAWRVAFPHYGRAGRGVAPGEAREYSLVVPLFAAQAKASDVTVLRASFSSEAYELEPPVKPVVTSQ